MDKEEWTDRQRRVQKCMREDNIEQLLIINPMSVYYLTGELVHPFERFWGFWLPGEGEGTLIANRLFHLERPRQQKILWYEDGQDVVGLLQKCIQEDAVLGVDEELPAKILLPFMEEFPDRYLCLGSSCVRRIRAVKSPEEIRRLKQSAAIADACAERIPGLCRTGMSERELGDEIIRTLKELGADENSWGIPLVAFGENAGDAHHRPGDRRLREGDGILADLGCRKEHYCSDITRTFFWGKPKDELLDIYRVVCEANQAAEAAVRPGIPFCELDKIARDVIEKAGYGAYFTHRLGHSIGLEGHECHEVSAGNEALTEPGMVFSVEPGIYIPGLGGVRIEDVVLVTRDGCELLNQAAKK